MPSWSRISHFHVLNLGFERFSVCSKGAPQGSSVSPYIFKNSVAIYSKEDKYSKPEIICQVLFSVRNGECNFSQTRRKGRFAAFRLSLAPKVASSNCVMSLGSSLIDWHHCCTCWGPPGLEARATLAKLKYWCQRAGDCKTPYFSKVSNKVLISSPFE